MPVVKRHRDDGPAVWQPLTVDTSEFEQIPTYLNTADQSISAATPEHLSTPVQQYAEKKEETLKKWTSLRDPLLSGAFAASQPFNNVCILCSVECRKIIECKDCGPCYFVCEDCAVLDHKVRPLHHMNIWKVPYDIRYLLRIHVRCAWKKFMSLLQY